MWARTSYSVRKRTTSLWVKEGPHRSAPCFKVTTMFTTSSGPTRAPTRRPAARILEKVRRTITRPPRSKEAMVGMGSPL